MFLIETNTTFPSLSSTTDPPRWLPRIPLMSLHSQVDIIVKTPNVQKEKVLKAAKGKSHINEILSELHPIFKWKLWKLEEPAPIHCKYKKTMVANLDYYTQQNYLLKLKGEKKTFHDPNSLKDFHEQIL